jgi:hypothetical protein
MLTSDKGRRSGAPASEILKSLADSEEDHVAVKEIVAAMGLRAHGIALILFSLPDAIPLPIPSLSTVLGIPLVLIAFHLVLFGEGSGLPRRVLSAQIPLSAIGLLARVGVPFLRALEYVTRPRLDAVLRYERWIGVVCLYLAVLLLMPIPFVNFPPALCLLLIAVGMVQRDGVAVLLGLAATLAMTVSLGFAAEWLKNMVFGPS